jgi:hypothetical protein
LHLDGVKAAAFAAADPPHRSGRSVWVFLLAHHLAAKAPDNAYWIVLDFLGFSRLNLDLSMGYADFRGQNFLEPFPLAFEPTEPESAVEAIWKGGLLHEASLTRFLFFCKQLWALIAVAVVCFSAVGSVVMAGLDPVIHENTVISSLSNCR